MKLSTLFFILAGAIGLAEVYSSQAVNASGTDTLANIADGIGSTAESVNPTGVPMYVIIGLIGLMLAFATPQWNKQLG